MVTIVQFAQPHFAQDRDPSGSGGAGLVAFAHFLSTDRQDESTLPDGGARPVSDGCTDGTRLLVAGESSVAARAPVCNSVAQVDPSDVRRTRSGCCAAERASSMTGLAQHSRSVRGEASHGTIPAHMETSQPEERRLRGQPRPAGAARSDGSRAASLPAGSEMNLEPVAQLHDQSMPSRKTCRKPPGLAIASDQHHFGIVSSPHAAGGAVSGQVAPTDLSGAQTQIHASAIRSAETRGGTKTGMAAHQILAIAKGKDQLTAVPQPAPVRRENGSA